AADEPTAEREIVTADAFFGKVTPRMLAAATRLQWVQSPTASLEHYLFPELTDHPCTLTNMRGLYSDVIAEHVFAYILSFTRNLHLYLRRQMEARWEAVGGEAGRHPFSLGQSIVTETDRAHGHLSGKTLGIVGFGAIGAEVAKRGLAFGMEIVAVDPRARATTNAGIQLWPPNRLPELLRESDFVVIAAPHTPQTEGLFRRQHLRLMKPSAYLINIGRGAIVNLEDLTRALEAGEIA
ncbi:MAG: D-2-hydroxyacid dehydrogenase, partial [bacterium]|nr:D-2-hydroxyacid dehydrogenase [bacterium]